MLLALLAAFAAAACGSARSAAGDAELLTESSPPPMQREFRGVWVATVANIDWPSARGLPPEQQRAELLRILDRAAELNLNAVILQVRPAADALYASEIEPWSEYLSGEAGQGPEPGYDPLEFAVAEAHRRGLELHAWFNPYRARHTSATSSIPESHISRSRPELVWTYGRHLWMDPGEPDVQDRTVEVVLDVVRRYDVDGIHLDDYFYPYRERDLHGNLLPFPDSATFARYRGAGGTLELHDWRRHNVDVLVQRLYEEIKAEKPWVKFGISPFGVWRPGHPRGIGGFDAYAELYADARKWLANGWLDYITPQLYWPIARADVSYPVLLRWWVEQNDLERHVWPSNFTSRWSADEIVAQVFVTRGMPGASGNVHFSARSLMQSADSVGERLAAAAYAEPALVPASPWIGSERPGRPSVAYRPGDGDGDGDGQAVLTPAASEDTWLWAIRTLGPGGWTTEIAPGWTRTHSVGVDAAMIIVTAVSRAGAESAPAILDRAANAGARASNLPVSRP